MRAAVLALRTHKPRNIVVATPVASGAVLAQLRPDVDELICCEVVSRLVAVGLHYVDFSEVTDDEVLAAIKPFERAN